MRGEGTSVRPCISQVCHSSAQATRWDAAPIRMSDKVAAAAAEAAACAVSSFVHLERLSTPMCVFSDEQQRLSHITFFPNQWFVFQPRVR